MEDIVMPRLSDTMEEGTILRWLKHDGEQVGRGEELVEIETDKATMTYESDLAGVLSIVAAEGATLAVGEVIAHVGVAGAGDGRAGRTAPEAQRPAQAQRPPETQRPAETQQPAETQGLAAAPGQPSQTPAGRAREAQQAVAGEPANGGERVRASPLAKRIARENGVDLRALRGSGPGGRIVKADVLAGASGAAAGAAGGPAGAPRAARGVLEEVARAKGRTRTVELTRTQQTIARRMAESKATIPDFSLLIDVDMEGCVALRGELRQLAHESPGEDEPVLPTYNDMVVKATALALREYPRANGSYRDGKLQLHSRVNVGVAVAAQDSLVVPTVFDADEKSLGEIARETRALAERVRAGAITPPELGGGTFTVSNLGMFGVRSFSAIINPPQAAILSVGALAPRAVAHEGELAARHTMTLTLACDHRILYGAEAALFAARVRELLQAPAALTL